MKYKIWYQVSIPNPSKQLRCSGGSVTSKIFEFPNLINAGESIYINFTKYTEGNQLDYSTKMLQLSLNIKNASHKIDRIEGYTELYASDEASNQEDLECKLNTARDVFAKLKR